MRRTVVVVIAARMLLGAPLSGQSSIVDEHTSAAVGERRDSTHREASGPILPEPLLRARRDEPLPPLPRAPESKWECVAMVAQGTISGASVGFLGALLLTPVFIFVSSGRDEDKRRFRVIAASTGAAVGFLYGAQRRECRGFLPPVSPPPARSKSVPFTRSYQYP